MTLNTLVKICRKVMEKKHNKEKRKKKLDAHSDKKFSCANLDSA